MKVHKKRLLSCMIIGLMLMGSQIMVSANVGNDIVVNLPGASSAYIYKYVTRTGDYSYIELKVDTIYPTNGGTDNYVYLKSALFNLDTVTQISNIYSAYETSTVAKKIYLREGTLNTKQLQLGLSNPYNVSSLSAVIDFDGK